MNARQKLLMYLSNGATPQATIPMPKTSKMRAMRELKAEGLALSDHGVWRLTAAGRLRVDQQKVDTSTDVPVDSIDAKQLPKPPPQWKSQPLHRKQSLFKTLIGY